MLSKKIYTIGYHNDTLELFINRLKSNGITALVDIRSSPYSSYQPRFNREKIRESLKKEGITYLYMGDQLGARYDNPELQFPDGQVDFSRVQETEGFKEGVGRLLKGTLKGFTIAMMCSEKEPIRCHRFGLVSANISKLGLLDVHHIVEDSVMEQKKVEDELLSRPGLRSGLFANNNTALEDAYFALNREIGWKSQKGKDISQEKDISR